MAIYIYTERGREVKMKRVKLKRIRITERRQNETQEENGARLK